MRSILGHYSVAVTERYAHLKPELFTAKDLGTFSLDLAPGRAVRPKNGQWMASDRDRPLPSTRKHKRKAGVAL